MKRLLVLLPLALLVGCVSNEPVKPQTKTVLTAPPLPPALTEMQKTMRPMAMKAADARVMSAAAPMVMAAEATSTEPALPYVARTTSITITNFPIFKLTATYDAQVYGFGVAVSDDLKTWISAGEARWTNAVTENPYLYAGTMEHRVWIGEPQWQVIHRPNGTTTNLWKIIVVDKTAQQVKRFYMVYPLGPVTGLPY